MKILILAFFTFNSFAYAQLKGEAQNPAWGGYWWSMRNAETVLGWEGEFGRKIWTKKQVNHFTNCLSQWSKSCDEYLKNKSSHLSPLMKYDLYVHKILKSANNLSATTFAKSAAEELKIHYIDSSNHPHYAASGFAGKCTGWALSTLYYPEPVTNKEFEGILFTPADMKALLATLYNGAQFFVPDSDVVGEAYREGGERAHFEDVLPKEFILALQKNIGREKRGLVADLDPGEGVWNHPVFGYELEYQKFGSEITGSLSIQYANDIVGIDDVFSITLPRMDFLFRKLDFKAKIPVNWNGDFNDVISSRWVGDSNGKHPDSLVLGLEKDWQKTILKYKNTAVNKEFNFQILKKINIGNGWFNPLENLLKAYNAN